MSTTTSTSTWLSHSIQNQQNHLPPLISPNGQFIFLPIRNQVQIYSLSTLSLLRTLTSDGEILSLQWGRNEWQLCIVSKAEVSVWDWAAEGKRIERCDAGQGVVAAAAGKGERSVVAVLKSARKSNGRSKATVTVSSLAMPPSAASSSLAKKKLGKVRPEASGLANGSLANGSLSNGSLANGSLSQGSLSNGKVPSPAAVLTKLGKTSSSSHLSISPCGNWVLSLPYSGSTVSIASTNPSSGNPGFVTRSSGDATTLTCAVWHPTRPGVIATGDSRGVVRLWFDILPSTGDNNTAGKATTTAMHWHSHAVRALAFSSNGASLISGGEESVLVLWNIASDETGRKKEFVPRLGTPIVWVTPTDQGYLVGLEDGEFVFVSNATLRIERRAGGLKMICNKVSGRAPLAVHSVSGSVVVPSSHPSSIQMYSPGTGSYIAELEVFPSNRVSRKDEEVIEPGRVGLTKISSDGKWMATCDSWKSSQISLKIWEWNLSSSKFELNTRLDQPHKQHAVTSLAFSDSSEETSMKLVSTGKDGSAKIWKVGSITSKKTVERTLFWYQQSSLVHRGNIPRACAFSEDASVLAIAFGRHVTIWDPETNEQINTFSTSNLRRINHLAIQDSAVIVSGLSMEAGEGWTGCWDILSGELNWKQSFTLSQLIAHPSVSKLIAVEGSKSDKGQSKVVEICSTSGKILRSEEFDGAIQELACNTSLCSDKGAWSLVALQKNGTIKFFGDNLPAVKSAASANNLDVIQQSKSRSIFSELFGGGTSVERETSFTKVTASPSQYDTIFHSPAHLMPSLTSLMSEFVSLSLASMERKTFGDGSKPSDKSSEDDEETTAVPMDHTSDNPRHIREVSKAEILSIETFFREQLNKSISV